MKNVLLKIAYDGTNYSGWQRQINSIAIENVVEDTLRNIFKSDIDLIGASRTDKGVHALSQYASFKIDTKIPIDRLKLIINKKLPSDIVILESREVGMDFHPRFHAKSKTYNYKILNSKYKIPQYRNYTGYVYKELDINLMREGSKYFLGEHDFTSFKSSGGNTFTNVRTIYSLDIEKKNEIIDIDVSGNGFLYNMVRIMVGTLIFVGNKKIEPKFIRDIILYKDRTKAGKCAPASGLTLKEIIY